MARRRSGGAGCLVAIGLLLLFGWASERLSAASGAIPWPTVLIVVAALVVVVVVINAARRATRRKRLLTRFEDEDIVGRIMAGQIWVGQTAEQLREAIGPPVTVDTKVLKTKKKDTWKYHQTGKKRFGLRVMLEDGFVVGWDRKG